MIKRNRLTAILGGLLVGLGAFGAHALKQQLSTDAIEIWKTGVFYGFLHVLASLSVGATAAGRRAQWMWLAGTIVFSGSLFGLAWTGIKWLGAITPIGGMLMLVGWVILALDRNNANGS